MLGYTQCVQGLSLSTLFKLASLRLIHHQGDPQIPMSTLTWRLCSVAHLQLPAGHRHLNAPSSLLTGKTKHDIALRSHGAQRQCLCSLVTQTWDPGFQLVKTAVHSFPCSLGSILRSHPQFLCNCCPPLRELLLLPPWHTHLYHPHFRRLERNNF